MNDGADIGIDTGAGTTTRRGERKGIPVESLLLDFIDSVLDTTEQTEADEEAEFSAWLKGELPPMTGTEAAAYWQKHGLLGGYSNEDVDSIELARRLREQAQTRPHILA